MYKSRLMLIILSILCTTAMASESPKTETAILAGGCFWCIESDFEKLSGVVDVVSGYTGGKQEDPSYQQVSAGITGHIEAVRVSFDPLSISYPEILNYFWRHIDPTRDDGQFCDRGQQYRPAIFYQGEAQKQAALASVDRIDKSKPFTAPLKVAILPADEFYLAEDYHQDYYKKNPLRYKYYRYRCGRDARVEELWGGNSDSHR